jgi:hypothetical protein
MGRGGRHFRLHGEVYAATVDDATQDPSIQFGRVVFAIL